ARLKIPKRFVGKSLANLFGYEAEIDAAKRAIGDCQSVFISGSCGCGKTHMALGLMLHWYSDHFNETERPIFIPSVEFFLELKHSFDRSISEREVMGKYTDTPPLIFADMGA